MATPYLQQRLEQTTSTQDIASVGHRDLPLLVISPAQTAGRGRSGATWETAPRALAVSLAIAVSDSEVRPLSLMAGVAAASVVSVVLKWPNDLMVHQDKVGGILVERSDGLAVVGMGLNLWWPEAPSAMAGLYPNDPGPDRHAELGALWGAELMRLIDGDGWPHDAYVGLCQTLGQRVRWEPDGSGRAIDVAADGGLVVEIPTGMITLRSGAVRHVTEVG
jgi:BirA family biotin operon repressor/biotin-[acetyl-CoA-carboxylase] ligase